MRTFTAADLAEAWNSGYWHGIDHAGPMNDAAINANNPYLHADEATPQAHLDRGGLGSD